TFVGEPVNFSKTFFGSVTARDVYPDGVPDGGDNLLPYFNLEIWGLPTSRPAHDPNNPGFIYQRFQRGIMHYDKSCGCTQGLLLADYLKQVLIGTRMPNGSANPNLPGDLAQQAQNSRFMSQYAPGRPGSLARPNDLAGSDLTNAFDQQQPVAGGGPAATAPSGFAYGFQVQLWD